MAGSHRQGAVGISKPLGGAAQLRSHGLPSPPQDRGCGCRQSWGCGPLLRSDPTAMMKVGGGQGGARPPTGVKPGLPPIAARLSRAWWICLPLLPAAAMGPGQGDRLPEPPAMLVPLWTRPGKLLHTARPCQAMSHHARPGQAPPPACLEGSVGGGGSSPNGIASTRHVASIPLPSVALGPQGA